MNQYPKYQIINHLTDTDLYKFNMCVAVLNCFPRAMVKYEFIDRNNTIYPQGFADKLMEQLQYMENIVIKLVSAKITEKRDWKSHWR